MKISISDYQDYLNITKNKKNENFCAMCGLETPKPVFAMCEDCFREAMQESPENEPAHPSEWEDA